MLRTDQQALSIYSTLREHDPNDSEMILFIAPMPIDSISALFSRKNSKIYVIVFKNLDSIITELIFQKLLVR